MTKTLKTSPDVCSSKRRWACKSHAKSFLKKHKWLKQHPYTCNICGFIHLTSYPKDMS